jgi:hypothetical protein
LTAWFIAIRPLFHQVSRREFDETLPICRRKQDCHFLDSAAARDWSNCRDLGLGVLRRLCGGNFQFVGLGRLRIAFLPSLFLPFVVS